MVLDFLSKFVILSEAKDLLLLLCIERSENLPCANPERPAFTRMY
jgi:hypothetical protein